MTALRVEAGSDVVELEPWQLCDLRRTARTLIPRAGVSSEIAGRALATS